MWGTGAHCQLGLGKTRLKSANPFLISSLMRYKIKAIQCGDTHTLALDANGKVFCWGNNQYGQCAIAQDREIIDKPTLITPLANQIVHQIAIGKEHSACLISTDIYMWGHNKYIVI